MADKPICKIVDCDKTSITRGWCTSHYKRWLKYGDPLGGPTRIGEPLAFLEAALSTATDECILWPYSKGNYGYGQVWVNGRLQRVPRIALERKLGRPIKPGMHAAHAPGKCHNPACFNPRHLREATQAENMADRIIDGTSNRGGKHGMSKLTEADVLAIRSDLRPRRVVAADYGIDRSTISDIKRGKSWSWL